MSKCGIQSAVVVHVAVHGVPIPLPGTDPSSPRTIGLSYPDDENL